MRAIYLGSPYDVKPGDLWRHSSGTRWFGAPTSATQCDARDHLNRAMLQHDDWRGGKDTNPNLVEIAREASS